MTKRTQYNYQEIINSKQFEDIVRIAAKTVDVPKWIDDSMPPQSGFLQIDFNHPDNERWKKAVEPPPFFTDLLEPSPSTKLFDQVLWEALKEGHGDEDKVWELFKQYLVGVCEGISTLLTGIDVRNGGRKGEEISHGSFEEKGKKWQAYQEYVDAQHKKYPKLSYNALVSDAVHHFNVSESTIKRHVKNPKR
jgi:hypothetical protein